MSISNIRQTVGQGIDAIVNAPVGAILGGAFTLAVGTVVAVASLPAPRVEIYNPSAAAACLYEAAGHPEGFHVTVQHLFAERVDGRYVTESVSANLRDDSYRFVAGADYYSGANPATDIKIGQELSGYVDADAIRPDDALPAITAAQLAGFNNGLKVCADRAVAGFDPSTHMHTRLPRAMEPAV